MPQTADRILKGKYVKIQGKQKLSDLQTQHNANIQASPEAPPAQARIIESNQNYALIEITCNCGNKATIKCQYAKQNKPNNKTQPSG